MRSQGSNKWGAFGEAYGQQWTVDCVRLMIKAACATAVLRYLFDTRVGPNVCMICKLFFGV